MRRIITLMLSLSLLLLVMAAPASAAESRVHDPYGILTANEQAEVDSALATASKNAGVKVFVYINDYDNISTPTESMLLSALGVSTGDDVAILLIDACEVFSSYYELFTYGDANKLISDGTANRILDDIIIYTAVKNDKDYVTAAKRFATLVGTEVPMARSENTRNAILFTVFAAIISGAVAVVIVVVRYKRKLKSPIYPLSKYATLSLNHSTDTYLRTDVVRTRINNSSGDGSGGGGRSGGGSRGRR